MKKFKILSFVLLTVLAMAILPVSALAVDEPTVNATAAIVMDTDTGEVYYEKNADTKVQPASTTKMMTALLVIEAIESGEISLADSVTAYSDCQYNMDEESSNADPIIEPGEVMSVEDLLYCAMLASANEACNILGEYLGGSISAFVDMMNSRAAEIGCTGTHFANTNGLEDANHYTTARDFALIAQEAVSHTLFVQICSTQNHTVGATNVNESRSLSNTNSLLNTSSNYYYEYAYGVKTGYFSSAGYCLVSAATYNDINLVCVVMGCPVAGDQYEDTLDLFQWVYNNFSYQQVLGSTQTLIDSIDVEMGTTDSTGVRAEESISAILPNDFDMTSINYMITLYHAVEGTTLEAPISAGEVLGEVTVVQVDENNNIVQTFGTSKLVATSAVEMSRGQYLRSQVKDLFQTAVVRRIITILIVLLAIYILLIIFYTVQRSRHIRSVRAAKKDRAKRMTKDEIKWLNIPEDTPREPQIDYFSDDDLLPEREQRQSRRSAPYDQDERYDQYDQYDRYDRSGRNERAERPTRYEDYDVSGDFVFEKDDYDTRNDRSDRSDRNGQSGRSLSDDEYFDSIFRRR